MPDIELRFHHDMLVLSAPIDTTLERQGIDAVRDRQLLNLMEPDLIGDALRLELMAGAQCLVTPTEDITRARLSHVGMEQDPARLAHAAVDIVADLKPQHILAEIGPCGLPLDPSSKASLNENRSQYADAARVFDDCPVDALFLNGFTDVNDLKCALMGVAQASSKPVFASVFISSAEKDPSSEKPDTRISEHATSQPPSLDEAVLESLPWPDGYETANIPSFASAHVKRTPMPASKLPSAIDVMEDLGAAVVGFETPDSIAQATKYAEEAASLTSLPLLAQLRVSRELLERAQHAMALTPLDGINAYTPDTMQPAAVKLFAAGVQFLRASGDAGPAFTGALAATVFGVDVRKRKNI